MKTKRDLFLEALLTTTSDVPFCDHQSDNRFLYFEVDKTIDGMERHHYLPLSICLRPSYGNEDEYGFSFFNIEKGTFHWVHITKRLAQS